MLYDTSKKPKLASLENSPYLDKPRRELWQVKLQIALRKAKRRLAEKRNRKNV